MENVLLHFVAPWEMQDEKTGRTMRGFSLQFISPYNETREGALGYRSTKTSVRDEAVYESLRKLPLPVMCELALEARPGADGKLTAVVSGVKNVKAVRLFQAVPAAPVAQG